MPILLEQNLKIFVQFRFKKFGEAFLKEKNFFI
jgi:hypothetical protein